MSAANGSQGSLQRSSWKAQAIRRGDIKISGPIPIPEDASPDNEEVKDFEKHGPNPPQDTAVDHPTQHNPEPPQAPPPPPPAVQTHSHTEALVHPGEDPHLQDGHRKSPPAQLFVPVQTTPERHRRSATEPMLLSPKSVTPETPTRALTRKKRKSGIRGVFRKMFGRKGREEYGEDDTLSVQRSQTHRQPQRVSVR